MEKYGKTSGISMEKSKTCGHGGSGYHPLGWLGHLGWLRSEMRGSRRGNPRGSFGGEGCQVMEIDFSLKKLWYMILNGINYV